MKTLISIVLASLLAIQTVDSVLRRQSQNWP